MHKFDNFPRVFAFSPRLTSLLEYNGGLRSWEMAQALRWFKSQPIKFHKPDTATSFTSLGQVMVVGHFTHDTQSSELAVFKDLSLRLPLASPDVIAPTAVIHDPGTALALGLRDNTAAVFFSFAHKEVRMPDSVLRQSH